MKIPIPDYLLRAWITHQRRIIDNVRCDPRDTRTVNALRLARKDLRNMEKHLGASDRKV